MRSPAMPVSAGPASAGALSAGPASAGSPASGTTRPGRATPTLAAAIVDIEEREGPRAAYAALQARLTPLRLEGGPVPADLLHLERRLVAECCALSQGR